MIRFIAFFCFAFMLILSIPSLQAQQGSGDAESLRNPMIAVLDLEGLRFNSKGGQSILEQLDREREALRQEFTEEEKRLHASRAELDRQRSLLSSEAVQERERRFQAELSNTQQRFQTRRENLEDAVSRAWEIWEQELMVVLESLVKDKGIDLILDQQAVIFTGRAFSINEETMDRLDQRLPSVTIRQRSPAAPGTGR